MEADPKALVDLAEKGAERDGKPQSLDRRLFMQLLCYGGCSDHTRLIHALDEAGLDAVLYLDVNDPHGVGLLAMSEDPAFFTGELRGFLNSEPFSDLIFKRDHTMMGRTYALGFERNLEDWLLERPRRVAMNRDWPWAVWYPLRRKGEFAKLPRKEQGGILMEHGRIGHAFGDADLGHDIRLACHGIDRDDNDFVIALIGKDLHPLSALVQAMRSTTQTSTYMEKMGPFFIGRAVWQGGKD